MGLKQVYRTFIHKYQYVVVIFGNMDKRRLIFIITSYVI